MMKRLCVLALMTGLVGCAKSTPAPELDQSEPMAEPVAAEPAAPAPHAEASPGKPQAPVTIELDLSGDTARVQIVASGDAEGLVVSLKGIDGLEIAGGPQRHERVTAAAREAIALPVAWVGDAPRGTLVVSVDGTFNGQARHAVKTFAIGGPKVQEDSGAVDSPLGPIMPSGTDDASKE